MELDILEYDPFKPHYYLMEDGEEELDTEPMNKYDWEEWLGN